MKNCPNCNGKLIFKKKKEIVKNKEVKIEGFFCKECGEGFLHEKECQKFDKQLIDN